MSSLEWNSNISGIPRPPSFVFLPRITEEIPRGSGALILYRGYPYIWGDCVVLDIFFDPIKMPLSWSWQAICGSRHRCGSLLTSILLVPLQPPGSSDPFMVFLFSQEALTSNSLAFLCSQWRPRESQLPSLDHIWVNPLHAEEDLCIKKFHIHLCFGK